MFCIYPNWRSVLLRRCHIPVLLLLQSGKFFFGINASLIFFSRVWPYCSLLKEMCRQYYLGIWLSYKCIIRIFLLHTSGWKKHHSFLSRIVPAHALLAHHQRHLTLLAKNVFCVTSFSACSLHSISATPCVFYDFSSCKLCPHNRIMTCLLN